MEAKGRAEAEQMAKKAEAFKEYKEGAMVDMLLEKLPLVSTSELLNVIKFSDQSSVIRSLNNVKMPFVLHSSRWQKRSASHSVQLRRSPWCPAVGQKWALLS